MTIRLLTAQHSAQRTAGIRRVIQAFYWLWQIPASKPFSHQPPLTQAVHE